MRLLLQTNATNILTRFRFFWMTTCSGWPHSPQFARIGSPNRSKIYDIGKKSVN